MSPTISHALHLAHRVLTLPVGLSPAWTREPRLSSDAQRPPGNASPGGRGNTGRLVIKSLLALPHAWAENP